jgi:penicillin-binding protein
MVNMKFLVYNKLNYMPNPLTPPEFLQEKVVIKRKESLTAVLKQIQGIMEKTPASKRRSMASFIPLDIGMNAPEEIDPRIDDGQVPDAPSNVILAGTAAENRLTFSPSLNPNVVGYRLYRSIDNEAFQKLEKVVTADQSSLFTVPTAAGNVIGYYITSVNIVGKESSPSPTVFSNGSQGTITEPSGGAGAVIAPPPSVPLGLSFQLNGINLQLKWIANPVNEQINQYNIFYSSTENGSYQKIGTVEQPQFEYFAGIYNGFYRINAVNKTSESEMSTAVAYTAP